MKKVAETLAELRRLTTAELVARYSAAWGRAPRVKHREYLLKRILWKREEARAGGLSTKAKERLEELISDLDVDLGERTVSGVLKVRRARRESVVPPAGTTITRPWKGRDVVVRVLDKGFEFEGEVYRSLSAISKRVTGSHWSGPHFFGLVKRPSG